jgi:plastocyanin
MLFLARLRPRSSRTLALVLLGALASPGCSDDDPVGVPNPPGNADAEFVIRPGAFDDGMMAFVPARDTVTVGQVVRMRNGDSIQHRIDTVTAGGPDWGTLSPGASADRPASTAGEFTFTCTIAGHTMSGILVVQP